MTIIITQEEPKYYITSIRKINWLLIMCVVTIWSKLESTVATSQNNSVHLLMSTNRNVVIKVTRDFTLSAVLLHSACSVPNLEMSSIL